MNQAGRAGDAEALNSLGLMLEEGKGLSKNADLAQAFYTRAAELVHLYTLTITGFERHERSNGSTSYKWTGHLMYMCLRLLFLRVRSLPPPGPCARRLQPGRLAVAS
jgi:hypothetical protein